MMRFIFAFIFAVLLFSTAQAQTKNFAARAVRITKNLSVSQLEPTLSPSQSLENWLQKTAGESAQIEWELNDCGSQSGEGEETGEFPLCVEAKIKSANKVYFGVMTAIGSFRKKNSQTSNYKIEGKPYIHYIYLGRASSQPEKRIEESLRSLRDLPAKLAELPNKQ